MTKDEALKLALEAFGEIEWSNDSQWQSDRAAYAMLAIKEALAQAEQEPVVWMYQNKSTHEVRFQKHMRSFVDHGAWYEVPLYSEPLANQEKTSGSPIKKVLAQPEQEPVTLEAVYETIIHWDEGCGKRSRRELARRIVSLYTTPPQRKPLTDEEIRKVNHHMVGGAYDYSFKQGVKWAEYKHGIKD